MAIVGDKVWTALNQKVVHPIAPVESHRFTLPPKDETAVWIRGQRARRLEA